MAKLKKKIRNALIYLFWLTGLPALRCWWLKRQGPLVRVIAFHDIKKQDTENFKRIIHFINRHCNALTPQEFLDKNFETNKINVLITFDDGYQSWHNIAFPILGDLGVGAVLFITSGFLETAGDDREEIIFCKNNLKLKNLHKPLSWEQLRSDLRRYPLLEPGGHTHNHADLANLESVDIHKEIQVNKAKLEKVQEKPLRFFAYPFGRKEHISSEAVKVVQSEKFSIGFTADSGFVDFKDKLRLSRSCIDPGLSMPIFKAWLYGGYDVLNSQ